MASLGVMNEIICTCGKCIFEVDANFCSACGDVMCKDCYTDCFTCGKFYCINCSQSATRCIKCDYKMALPKNDEKAFLILNGKVNVATPIKNSTFMIKKTSLDDARQITLELAGKKYKYCYRQMILNEETNKLDYFLYFEEVMDSDIAKRIKEAFDAYSSGDDYDDYGNPWTGW